MNALIGKSPVEQIPSTTADTNTGSLQHSPLREGEFTGVILEVLWTEGLSHTPVKMHKGLM